MLTVFRVAAASEQSDCLMCCTEMNAFSCCAGQTVYVEALVLSPSGLWTLRVAHRQADVLDGKQRFTHEVTWYLYKYRG